MNRQPARGPTGHSIRTMTWCGYRESTAGFEPLYTAFARLHRSLWLSRGFLLLAAAARSSPFFMSVRHSSQYRFVHAVPCPEGALEIGLIPFSCSTPLIPAHRGKHGDEYRAIGSFFLEDAGRIPVAFSIHGNNSQPGNLYLSGLIKGSVKLAGCAFHGTRLRTFRQSLLLHGYSLGTTATVEIPPIAPSHSME